MTRLRVRTHVLEAVAVLGVIGGLASAINLGTHRNLLGGMGILDKSRFLNITVL